MNDPERDHALGALLKEIDAAARAYKARRCGYADERMEELLCALKDYHPLSLRTRRHGMRLAVKLFGHQDVARPVNRVETALREGFQLVQWPETTRERLKDALHSMGWTRKRFAPVRKSRPAALPAPLHERRGK